MRILVLTRSYPAPGNLYQYPFVHRRVLGYAAAGHQVTVFRPTGDPRIRSHSYEGVTCLSGNSDVLREVAAEVSPDVIAAHGFSESMHEVLAAAGYPAPVRAWLHGSEIPAFFRQKAQCIADPDERAAALDALQLRCRFWDSFLARKPERFKLVFVSNSAVALAREDWGDALADGDFAVIPNPIDTDLFAYRPKTAKDRLRILMIRPFDSATYGNDLAVSAIGHLSERTGFDRLHFTIVGDGPLFEDVLEPAEKFPNVEIQRRFLTQREIAGEHRRHGIFLVPTRLDTHGVSRDEAMSSGLVPVTNLVSAVPEFVVASCAGLAPADDAAGLADAISTMIDDPALFLRRSAAAAERVRLRTGHQRIIPEELALLGEACRG